MELKIRGNALLPFFLGLGIVLSGCSFSLASDVTPPPDSQTFSSQGTAVPVDTSDLPIVSPNAQNGAVVYQEKCAPCHGETGMGDGPQSSSLSVDVPALADNEVAQGVRPVEWYQMVTNGNIEQFMPPFKSLDDRTRWDVVAYALSLSMNSTAVEQGKAVYTANCVDCHGDQGQGSSQAPGWLEDPGKLAKVSTMEMASVITSGRGNMPAFQDVLDQTAIISAANYIRWMGFGGANLDLSNTPVQNTATLPAFTTITVKGKISLPSDKNFPEAMSVTLLGYDGMDQAFELKTEADSNGNFVFENVDNSGSRTLIAATVYEGTTFNSDAYHTADETPAAEVDLPIQVYASTVDTSALKVDRMHIFFDFTTAGYIQVAELFVLNNTGNQVITSAAEGGGILQFDLPEGAANLQFRDSSLGERYLKTENGFADTQSIPPGSGTQILFAYDLPFEKKMTLQIPIPWEADSVVIMVPRGMLDVAGNQIQPMGSSSVQGDNYDFYAAATLEAGSLLDLNLAANNSLGGQTGISPNFIIGISTLVVALIGVLIWYLSDKKRRKIELEPESILAGGTQETIMDAIIALDDRYKAGEILEEAYHNRRSALKEQLKSLSGK